MEKKTDELSLKKKNQESLLQQEEQNKKSLTKEEQDKKKNINLLSKKEKQLTQQIKQKQTQRKKLQNQINAAISAEVRKQTAIASKNNKETIKKESKEVDNSKESGAKSTKYVMSATPEEIKLSNSFSANKGRLPWPVEQGVVTSSFGTHPHPDIKGIMIENNGIDIQTPRGSSVRSVFDGVVSKIFIGPTGQQNIIIRHGEYLTVYTNLSSVSVSVGSKVSTKQAIGTVYTNSENVSEFNFQVWKGSSKQNPSAWIR